MLIGNQFDSYTLWRPATRSDPVAIQSIPGEKFLVRAESAADASLAPQAGKQVTTIVGAIGSENGAGRDRAC